MDKYKDLRNKYLEFFYKGYNIEKADNEIKVIYDFEIKGLSEFHPTWTFPVNNQIITSAELIENIVFNLGMVELISYWKITCSPKVYVQCGKLTEEQTKWWKKLYFKGLGEFFYVNSINADYDTFMSIESSGATHKPHNSETTGKAVLIPVGGGKDSAVTLELLKDFDRYPYIMNSRGATETTVVAANLEDKTIRVKRTLDKNMLELNKQGYLNGHTPFSALVAFSSILVSHLMGMEYVALSNESSANESTVNGSDVNHQYSKSYEFEKDFNEYEKKYINSGVLYFSFLRPLSEYQIAMIFSHLTAYHDIFRSCNAGSKQDIWCGKCPKCLFVFLIMSAHFDHDRLVEIFGTDILEDEDMLEDFKKLIGILPEKPFECVGSRDEINFSICKAIEKMNELPKLFEYYKTTELYEKYSALPNPYLTYYNEENYLEEKFRKVLQNHLGI